MMKKGLLITLGVLILFGAITAFWAIGVSNTEIETIQLGDAQQEVCDAFYDKMWNILVDQAGVANEYKEAFVDIYPKLMDARYSEGGDFMKWIQESNPDFNISLYSKLQASIEGERNGLLTEQQKLIDIDKKHKVMRKTFPKKLVIGNRPDIGYLEDENGVILKKGITLIKSGASIKEIESGVSERELYPTK